MKKFFQSLVLFIKYSIYPDLKTCNFPFTYKEKEKTSQEKILQELLFAQYFNDSIKDSEWLKKQNFTATKGAANYSLLFLIFSVLQNGRPNNVLELGLGQSSKITTQYANYFTDTNLTILEHNKEWINVFKNNLIINNNINLVNAPLKKISINNCACTKYNLDNILNNDNKYDCIIIDGPIGGSQHYPRTNVIDLIPNNLAKKFIIILDDYERPGEQNTANLIFKSLKENNIFYRTSTYYGMKKQLLITSFDYEFLHWV